MSGSAQNAGPTGAPSGNRRARRQQPRRPRDVHAPTEEHEVEHEDDSDEVVSSAALAWIWPATKLLFGLALVLGSAFVVAWGAHTFAVTTERFGIVEVVAEGSRRYDEQQLLRLAGAKRGQNLFALDLAQAEAELTKDPWIASAKLTRKLPGTLEIRVDEYVAEAVAAIDGALYLVTREGQPILQLEGRYESDFPVVTGVSGAELAADRDRALERIALGIEILRKYERLKTAESFAAQEIQMAPDGQVSLVVGSNGLTLHLGKGPFRQKLLMAARVIGKVRARGQTPGIVFLDNEAHPERVVVRMR